MCALLLIVSPASAQTADQQPRASIAVETDVLAYLPPGYSAILSVSFRNGLQVAFGMGSYRPTGSDLILIKGATSLQLFRTTYRFRGPFRNGPAVGVVVLNENQGLRAFYQTEETQFRTLRVGISGGHYHHIGQHFYLYPTAAYTHNTVRSSATTLDGRYSVKEWSPKFSVHAGWRWAWRR